MPLLQFHLQIPAMNKMVKVFGVIFTHELPKLASTIILFSQSLHRHCDSREEFQSIKISEFFFGSEPRTNIIIFYHKFKHVAFMSLSFKFGCLENENTKTPKTPKTRKAIKYPKTLLI